MLQYLRIFSFFLLTFGIVGAGVIAFGIDPGIGTSRGAMGIMVLQTLIAALILWGFRLHRDQKLGSKGLMYGGWGLIALYAVVGQIWMNMDPE
ncbi:hypothetical protein ACXYTJ_09980 [Gilvimarinus sp. F26214L]|uniref:hypothetical protein n=1 Tax=Gilvimarinus sp. DZF01 TaxID=3461371 RepID=UPI004045A72A